MSALDKNFKSYLLNALPEILQKTKNGQPNINQLGQMLWDMQSIRLNIKHFGYQLAFQMRDKILSGTKSTGPARVGLKSKPSIQADIESNWVRYWCNELHIEPIYHRKIWELCYVPQALYEYIDFIEGMRGIGFGCGEEPLPSLFAKQGFHVMVTDLDSVKSAGLGWTETAQHTQNLDKVYYPEIVSREVFDRNVSLRYVNMNEIPDNLNNQFDFCWSVCALEHLGSVQKGLDFIENSLKVLKPGGLAIHTTEFNYTDDPDSTDNWMTVLFKKQHFIDVADRIKRTGHTVIDLDFNTGNDPLDHFIDIPPFDFGEGWISKKTWGNIYQGTHLKLSVDGFPSTCFGLIVKKA
jgi:2-polyprenyl-3-methyl-5-hydroxy-6-metoxy-1,4-benzoquinol methylase